MHAPASLRDAFALRPATEGRTWFDVTMVADQVYVVNVFGVIGDWEVDAIEFVNQIQALDGDGVRIELRIDSPGGSVPAGVLMMSAIAEMKATVIAKIWGQAFSMGSLIAMACDEVHIAKDAYVMIHNPRGIGIGGAADLRAAAEYLDKIRTQAVDRYAARAEKAGHTREEVEAAMDATTYYTALEAIEFGLADTLIEPVKSRMCATDPAFAAAMLESAPAEIVERFVAPAQAEVASEPEAFAEAEADPQMIAASNDPEIVAMKSDAASAPVSAARPAEPALAPRKTAAVHAAELRARQIAALQPKRKAR